MFERKFIPISEPSIGEEEKANVMEAVSSGWISSKGPFISDFEDEFSNFIGAKHGVSTSNGTTALHLALSALNVGKGDNVIAPDFTFISPINAILYNQAVPKLVDSTESNWNLDPKKIEEQIDEKTKAIVVVHLYGHPADMNPIIKIAKENDLKIIEDCAEAHGALYRGQKVGTFGDVSCFSFYGNKIMTTGEGGMCLTNDQELAERMETLRDHGMKPSRRYWHDEIGYNYRMTNLQAAIGSAQVRKLGKLIEQRRKLASIYTDQLRDIDEISLQPEESWAKSVFWLYSILMNNKIKDLDRDVLSKRLLERGIDNRQFFYPAHVMPPYVELGKSKKFPVADKLSQMGLNLPSSARLGVEEISYITDSIREIIRDAKRI